MAAVTEQFGDCITIDDDKFQNMLLIKRFSAQTAQARVLYLCCLSCVVVLVFFFSYSLFPHLHLRALHIAGSQSKTAPDFLAPFVPEGLGRPAEDDLCFAGPGGGSKSRPNEKGQPTYAIILPTYTKHLPYVVDFLQSYMCLCTDHQEVDIHLIVSDSKEVKAFQDAIDGLKRCGERFSIFPTPKANINGPKPKINIINFYDIVPDAFRSIIKGNISAGDTSALLNERGRYQYQTIKKLSAAIELEYDWGLWLDSEAVVVQPFSMREVFDSYIKTPTVWRSKNSRTDFMVSLITGSANVLGRDIESFGKALWNLESVQWMLEKEVVNDLVQSVEKAHKQDFWTVWATRGSPFEINLYNLHIQARKLESNDQLFTKYQVVETEREMDRFGMEAVPGFSRMMRHYGQRLLRFDDLNVAPPEVIDRFLLDTPINILCVGGPPLHNWWQERNKTL
ncbi:hypothetical protein CGCVW01_v005625 [Colletotrichum viniferum]|nr:hypothetical protein CGCVW01_v005625 [Colletotrichum viniferum]